MTRLTKWFAGLSASALLLIPTGALAHEVEGKHPAVAHPEHELLTPDAAVAESQLIQLGEAGYESLSLFAPETEISEDSEVMYVNYHILQLDNFNADGVGVFKADGYVVLTLMQLSPSGSEMVGMIAVDPLGQALVLTDFEQSIEEQARMLEYAVFILTSTNPVSLEIPADALQ